MAPGHRYIAPEAADPNPTAASLASAEFFLNMSGPLHGFRRKRSDRLRFGCTQPLDDTCRHQYADTCSHQHRATRAISMRVGDQELALLTFIAGHGAASVGEVAEAFGAPRDLSQPGSR